MISVKLISTGKALPSQIVTSEDLDVSLNQSQGYTFKKSGVLSRHVALATQSQSQLGAQALTDALRTAGLGVESIDLLISACGLPEQALPNTACFIAAHAGLPAGCAAFDVNASCLSFLTALRVAAGLLQGGGYSRIAIVSSDLASRGLNWAEPESSLIFGDGAAAVIVEKGHAEQGIRAFKLATYPQGRRYCEIRAGGSQCNPRMGAQPDDHIFQMDGKAVFKLAMKVMPSFFAQLMEEAGVALSSIDTVVPHQASYLSLAHAAKLLSVPDSKIIKIYKTHGNQVAASIPTVLHEAYVTGRANPGSRLLMMGTAAGFTVGGMVLDL